MKSTNPPRCFCDEGKYYCDDACVMPNWLIHKDSKEPEGDQVFEPSHYTDNVVEPINLIMRNEMSFALGNAVKYLARAGKKQYQDMTMEESKITDLQKAKRYIEMEINLINGEEKL